jgi:TP901 family phage tail tape measure protein
MNQAGKVTGEFTKLTAQSGKAIVDVTHRHVTNEKAVGKASKANLLMNEGMVTGQGVIAKHSKGLGDLGLRALATIPIWQAMRIAMAGVFGVIPAGIKQIVDLDTAIRRGFSVLDTTEKTPQTFDKIKTSLLAISKDTNQPFEKLGEAFLSFTTAGLSAEVALKGTSTAAKLATGTFSDAKNNALALTDTYNLFGKSLDGVIDKEKQMDFVGGLLIKASGPNVASVEQITKAFEVFGAAANVAGLSLDETISLIASLGTLGVRGAEGGSALSTAFKFLATRTQEVNDLFATFNQQVPENMFQRYVSLIRIIQQLPKELQVIKIEEIFGIKGLKATASFTTNLEVLLKTVKDLKGGFNDVDGVIKLLSDRNLEMKDSLAELQKEAELAYGAIGKSVIEGVTGTDKLDEELKLLIETYKLLGEAAKSAAFWITFPAREIGKAAGKAAAFGDVGLVTTLTTEKASDAEARAKAAHEELRKSFPLDLTDINIKSGVEPLLTGFATEAKAKKLFSLQDLMGEDFGFTEFEQKANASFSGLTLAGPKFGGGFTQLLKGPDERELDRLFKQIKAIKEVGDESKLSLKKAFLTEDIERFVNLADAAGLSLTKEAVTTDLMAGSWQKILAVVQTNPALKEELKKLGVSVKDITAQQSADEKNLQKIRVDASIEQLQYLKVLGFTEQELAQQKVAIYAKEKGMEEDLAKARLENLNIYQKRVSEIGETIKSSFQTNLTDLLSAKQTPGQFGANFGQSIQDSSIQSTAKSLTDVFAKTGVFKSLGTAGVFLEDTISKTGNPVVDAVTQGSRDIVNAVKAGPDPTALSATNSIGGKLAGPGGIFGALGGLFGGGTTGPQQLSREQLLKSNFVKGGSGKSAPTGLAAMGFGDIAGVGIGAVTGFMAGSQRGTAQGIMGGLGGALTGLAPFLGALGPIGAVAGIGLTIASMFGGKKKEAPQISETSREFAVASRIDVTNKKLDVVNRNLIALKNVFTTYVLPESAYFSETRNISDTFSIQARRGLA